MQLSMSLELSNLDGVRHTGQEILLPGIIEPGTRIQQVNRRIGAQLARFELRKTLEELADPADGAI